MNARMVRRPLIAIALGLCLGPLSLFAAPLAFDKASDPAYNGVWTNGSNGGVGWQAGGWQLFVADVQTNISTANFISSSTNNNASGDSNADLDIDTSGVAWGMVGVGPGGTQDVGAIRFFNGSLTNGQRFVVFMDNGFIPVDQFVGFYLHNTNLDTRLQFLATNQTFVLQGGTTGVTATNTGIANTDEGLRIEVELVDIDTVNVFVTKLVDGTQSVFSNITLGTVPGGHTHEIGGVSFINTGAGNGATNQAFFNLIQILPNPADANFFADLAIDKSISDSPVIANSNFTYTVTVTNSGPSTATAVTVTDTPPAGITFVTTPSQGTCVTNNSGLIICDLGNLASSGIASVTVAGVSSSIETITNVAVVTALNIDPNPTNNAVANFVDVVTPAALSVSPANQDFGAVATGTTAQATFVVTNSGGAVLTGTASVALSQFAIASGSPFSIPGFGTTNVVIDFTPDSEAAFTDNVIFASNGGVSTNQVTGSGAIAPVADFTGTPTSNPAPLSVSFTDTSTGTITNRSWDFGDLVTTNTTSTNLVHQYDNPGTFTVILTVSGPLGDSAKTNANYIIASNTNATPLLAVAPSSRNFGTLAVGATSTQSFSVINSGIGTLGVTSTVSGTSFSLLSASPTNVLAGQTSTVSIAFAPLTAGAFTGSVVFTSNGGVSTNAITGAATNVVVTPVLTVTPASRNFGTLSVGSSSTLSFSVINSGVGTLSGTSTVSGTSFTLLSGSPFSVSAGQTSSVAITFAPATAGAFTGSVVFASNGGISTNPVTGAATNVVAAAPVAAFTASPTTGEAPLIVSFTDASTGTITNHLWNFGDGNTSSSVNPTHVYTNGAAFAVSLTVRGPGGSNTVTHPIVVTGVAKNSPVGDWEVKVSGADKGIAFITLSNNATATGYEIRMKSFGLDTLSGTWGLDAKGKLTGSFIETLLNATNWTGSLTGKAKTDKSFSASLSTSNGVYKWKGVPATTFPDLSGTWSGQVTIAKTSTNVQYAITMNATNSGVFDVARTTTNTVIGQMIATSKDAVNAYITINSNQTTLSGKFKESKSSMSLKGSDTAGDKIKLDLIKQ